jgi:hypothetical protein
MKDAVNKAGNWASNISNITKVLFGFFVVIFAIGTAWYQIETNSIDNIRQDEQFKQMTDNQTNQFTQIMGTVNNQFEVWGQRSNKRHQRTLDEADKLHHEDDKIRQDIKEIREQNLDLIKEIWYLKGKLDE